MSGVTTAPPNQNSGGYQPVNSGTVQAAAGATDPNPFDAGSSTIAGLQNISVYTGQRTQPLTGPHTSYAGSGEFDQASNTTQPITVSASQYMESTLYSMDPAQIRQLQKQLQQAGYSGVQITGLIDQATVGAYGNMLIDTSLQNAQGGTPLTPEQYLAGKAQEGKKNGTNGPGGTRTDTSVNITDPATARAAAEAEFESKLGRRPKSSELSAFYAALTTYERANPNVTTSTTNNAGTATDTTSTGGVASPTDFADQYLSQNFGGQVGTHDALHYFGLVTNALSGPPGGIQEVAN